MNSQTNYYLVVGQLSNFTFDFADPEQDSISFRIVAASELINSFVQKVGGTDDRFSLLLQATERSEQPVELILQYTDSYHKRQELWTDIRLSLYLFASDPPTFASELQHVTADRCSAVVVKLPEVSEVNGQNYTVSLARDTPGWVVMLNNSFVLLNTINMTYDIPRHSEVTVIAKDVSEAWSKHTLMVDVSPLMVPSFGYIEDMVITEPNMQMHFEVQISDAVQVVE